MKPAHHQTPVVRIDAVRVHTNADTLEIVDIQGYQCVVKKGAFKVGDLAIYVYPESVIPQTAPFKFIWEPYVGLDGHVREIRQLIDIGLLLDVSEKFTEPIAVCKLSNKRGFIVVQLTDQAQLMFAEASSRSIN